MSYSCKQLQDVIMSERSKAADSSVTTCPSFQEHNGILVHVCGRGFKSSSWQEIFVGFSNKYFIWISYSL